MPFVYVARHGETTWNIAGRYQGRRESALSALGVRQGFALAAEIAARPRITRIVSSPLWRCVATARFVADRVGLAVQTDPALLEIAHGTWEGRYRDEISQNDRELYLRWRSDPSSVGFSGGETLRDVADRWQSFARSFDPSGDALVVTHDAVVRAAIVSETGGDLSALWNVRVYNASYALFSVERGAWTLIDECIETHLTALQGDLATQAL